MEATLHCTAQALGARLMYASYNRRRFYANLL